MKSSALNISLSDDLLRKIDQVARKESRSRSKLIREAAWGYIDRKLRWKQIFDFGKLNAARKGIAESDIEAGIRASRREKKA